MLEKIKEAVIAHKNIYDEATNVFNAARKDLHENYKGNLFTAKMNEAKQVYEDTLMESRESNYATCVEVLTNIGIKAQGVITEPVPADFPATLEAIRAMKNLTKAEMNAFVNRYKGNYLAYRAICDVVGGAKNGFAAVTIDKVTEMIERLEADLHNYFYDFHTNSYRTRLFCEGSVFDAPDAFFTAFLNGRFEEAEALEEAKKSEETAE